MYCRAMSKCSPPELRPIDSALIDGTFTRLSARLTPSLAMNAGYPAHVAAQLVIAFGPDQQMPVIWHHTVLQQADRACLVGFSENLEEHLVLEGVEQRGVASYRFMTWKTNLRNQPVDVEAPKTRSHRSCQVLIGRFRPEKQSRKSPDVAISAIPRGRTSRSFRSCLTALWRPHVSSARRWSKPDKWRPDPTG